MSRGSGDTDAGNCNLRQPAMDAVPKARHTKARNRIIDRPAMNLFSFGNRPQGSVL